MKCSVRAALGRMRSCHASRRTPRAERGIPCHSQSRRQRRRGVRQKRPVRRARRRRQLVHQGLERGASRALSGRRCEDQDFGPPADLRRARGRSNPWISARALTLPRERRALDGTTDAWASSIVCPAARSLRPVTERGRAPRMPMRERARAYPPDLAPGPVGRLGCPCRSRTAILRAGSVSIADAHSQITAAFRGLHEM